MNLDDRKLAPNFVWLFALAALGIAIAVTKLVPGVYNPKVWAGIYAAVYGAGAVAGTFLTRTGALRSIGAFTVAGAGLGIFYYVTVSQYMQGTGMLGTRTAVLFMAVFGGAAIGGGLGGTLFGLKARQSLARTQAALRR